MRSPDTLSIVVETLARSLRGAGPGRKAQRGMAPSGRTLPKPDELEPGVRRAAALVLLYPHERVPHLLLTRRTDTVAVHKGQIALPGGAQEGDEPLVRTALREAAEETGASSALIQVMGSMTPIYIPVSGFFLTPFVAWTKSRPDFEIAPIEVAELIETPVAALLDPACVHREIMTVGGARIMVPYYAVLGHKVWGATAMILAELCARLNDIEGSR